MNKEIPINKRNSNIELLRIICMTLILFHHGVVHSNFNFNNGITLNNVFLSLFIFGGKFGVDVFILISGYFLCKKKFNVEKILKLYGQLAFYIIFILSIVILFFPEELEYRKIIDCLYPFQGFAVNYLYLYLLSPYVNIFSSNLTKQEFTKVLVILTVVLSLLPTFLPRFDGFYLLSWMIYVYLIGSYIRIYYSEFEEYKNKLMIISFASISLSYVLSGLSFVVLKKTDVGKYLYWFDAHTFYGDSSFFLLLAAVCCFLYFINIDLGYSNFINTIAKASFGVLLFHDNPFRDVIFTTILQLSYLQEEAYFPLYFIMAMILIYIFASGIDLLRIKYIEKRMITFIDIILKKIMRLVKYYKSRKRG